MAQGGNDFNAIKISLASPELIKLWSYGEVMKPETINYRTLRPEKDGLFCEKIFGPTKDWECYCGKYKKIRHRGITCDRCGVEIARAKVRRERMGHIQLAAPVAHIWFSKGTPSRLGLMLNLSPKNLDRVLYFAQYIITNIDEDERAYEVNARHAYMGALVDRLAADGAAGTAMLAAAATRLDPALQGYADGVGALLKAADGAALGALLDGVDVLQSDMAALGDRAADPIARMAANAEIDEPNALGDKAAELDKSVGALRDEIEKMVGRLTETDSAVNEARALQAHAGKLSAGVAALQGLAAGISAEYGKKGLIDAIKPVSGGIAKINTLVEPLSTLFSLSNSVKALNDYLAEMRDDPVKANYDKMADTPQNIDKLRDIEKATVAGVKKISQEYADALAELPKHPELDDVHFDVLDALTEIQDIKPYYEGRIIPLREGLYDTEGSVEVLPEGCKDWREAGRRYDRFENTFQQKLRGLADILNGAVEVVEADDQKKAKQKRKRRADEDAVAVPKYSDEAFKEPLADYESAVEDFTNTGEEIDGIESLHLGDLLTETQNRTLGEFADRVFDSGMGAEAVLELLSQGDMEALHNYEAYEDRRVACIDDCAQNRELCIRHCRHRRDVSAKPCHERGDFCNAVDCLQKEIRDTSGQRQKKAYKRLRLIESFRKSGNKPEWMIMTVQPVLPPELRPMVQLDGGRFATSDLNDLYRRVINRNNRLKRLIDLQAPEIIVRNEKRMLQEAVDALVDNGRRGRAVAGSHNHKLKSLSDLLRGKQGRFRQNLLGKRVDYSGRSVIIVGPELKLDQCGLPRKMALELFKPFVMNRLVMNGYAHNIKSAKRLAESERPEVWDILENVVRDRPVLLNRAPTLHRLGIQAFQPVLIEGSAIRLHPLVTTAFNADFDGDQMAVHVPLSKEAVWEAKRMMLSTYNMLAPSSGEPIVAPTLDMVLGCFYMTQALDKAKGSGRRFAGVEDARIAYDHGKIDLRAPVIVRRPDAPASVNGDGAANGANGASGADDADQWMETTPGRIIFNDALPDELGFINEVIDKSALKDITSKAHDMLGSEATSVILDNVKDMGFHYASKSGITISIHDVEVPSAKAQILGDAQANIDTLDEMFNDGLLTEDDRYKQAVDIWTAANDDLTGAVEGNLSEFGGTTLKDKKMSNSGIGLYMMATSGAKGNIAQIKQMAGMRGLMSDPKGRIIDRPIKASFREGLSVLEYFISTHGARKGLTDTALRTADSGYLTRRLIDVAQELIILEEDCGTAEGLWIENGQRDSLLPPFEDRAKSRYAAELVADPDTGEVLADRNDLLTPELLARIAKTSVAGVKVRSALACEAERGLCRMCYGLSLATWNPIMIGEAVGIVAAQSIGEPGTQLTMRTFHTGGIAGSDITSGLPRVQELFEARVPKGEAVLSEIDGDVEITETTEGRIVSVASMDEYFDEYIIDADQHEIVESVENGSYVEIGDTIAKLKPREGEDADADVTALAAREIVARVSGVVSGIAQDAGATVSESDDGESEGEDDGRKYTISITYQEEERREYTIPAAAHLIVGNGDHITAGEPLTAGPKNPQLILSLQGLEAVRQYLIDEVQNVYRSQGVTIHDKHIEVIVSQMLRKVEIDDAGDANLLPGDQIDRKTYAEHTADVLAEGGEPPTARPILLGITRASLKMDSFLSAASFQETTRVLTEAAVNGERDFLRGLKENVIIGRLIPARLDLTEEGRAFLDVPDDEPESINPFARRVPFTDLPEIAQTPFGFDAPPPALDEREEAEAPVGDD